MPLPSGNRWKQRDHIPLIKGCVQSVDKMYIPAVFEDIDKVPKGFRSGKNQIVQALIPHGELREKCANGRTLREIYAELRIHDLP